jgi:transcription antitermination factor NusG
LDSLSELQKLNSLQTIRQRIESSFRAVATESMNQKTSPGSENFCFGSERSRGTERAKLRPPRALKKEPNHVPKSGEQAMDYEIGKYPSGVQWFAVWTRSRQEKTSAAMLEAVGVPHFLPLKSEVRQWSDRKQTIAVPLFTGYLFVRINPAKDSRLEVLKTPGIAGFVGNQTGPLPVPDQQIEDIRTVLEKRVECVVLPMLHEGDPVRVVRGPLTGVEGRLVRGNSSTRLAIFIEMIHKTLVVSVSRNDVELIEHRAAMTQILSQTPRNLPGIGQNQLR